jgi:hypothetical protein
LPGSGRCSTDWKNFLFDFGFGQMFKFSARKRRETEKQGGISNPPQQEDATSLLFFAAGPH